MRSPVLLLLTVVAIAGPASAATPATAARINVILITVDTLRADHVGVYGHRLDTTPALDRFAKRAVRFDDATVQWPQTWPSIASMMTGMYPATTTIRFKPQRSLPQRLKTLAEILKDVGYRTAAVVANVTLGKEFAFDQGFDEYVESWVDQLVRRTGKTTFTNVPGRVKRFTNATIVTDKALAIIDEMGENKPFFLWLHYIDPHGPYLPPKEYRSLFKDAYPLEPAPARRFPGYQSQEDARVASGLHDVGFYKAQYDRSIRYFDDELGRLLATIDTKPWKQRTLVVLTADHGEGLGEHRYYFQHGAVPYQTTARVPLLMALDGHLPAGEVVRQPVGLIDVVPTILDLVGAPPLPLAGGSLVPLMRGDIGAAPRYVFMEAGHRPAWQLIVRRGPWKLVLIRDQRDKRRFDLPDLALFNLQTDPGETKNVIEEQPGVAEELKTAMVKWQNGIEHGELGAVKSLDPATREMMRALGYGE